MNSTSPSSESRQVGGLKLNWLRWHPPGKDFRAAFFFLHGQGDYGERYQEVADFFLTENIAFATCDLPGHGKSPGKRGHLPSFEIVREITREGLAEARHLVPDKPVGFGGHSVGGLLALYLLGELDEQPDFSWISSPLLKPEAGQPSWKPALLKPISYLLPRVTLSTGVTSELCRHTEDGETPSHVEQFHSRISLSWGRTLLELAEVVRTQPERLPYSLPLFLSQGQEDRICPAQYCEELAERLQRDGLQLALYPKARHEPFADDCRDEVFADLREWIHKVLPASESRKTV